MNAAIYAPSSTAYQPAQTNDPRDRDTVNTPAGGLYYRWNVDRQRWEYWSYHVVSGSCGEDERLQMWRPSHYSRDGWSPSTRFDVVVDYEATWAEPATDND